MRRSLVLSSMVVSATIAASAVGFATAAAPVGSTTNPIKAKTSTTKGFNPKVVTVAPGARVYFKNTDHITHNAVQDAIIGKPKFRSGKPTTKDFSVKAPLKPGRYSYICEVHGFMRGTLIVKKK